MQQFLGVNNTEYYVQNNESNSILDKAHALNYWILQITPNNGYY